jgi:hypothetical protein
MRSTDMRTELSCIYSNLLCPRQDRKSPNEPVLVSNIGVSED